jgi:hypothetical protein
MATPAQIMKQISDIIESSAEKFNNKLPDIEQRIWKELQGILKELDTKGDKILQSVKNLRLVGNISRRLLKIIIDDGYKKDVKEYLEAFNEITKLQNQYFKLIQNKFKPTPLLQAIREYAVSTTLDSLTEVGLSQPIGNLKKILLQNITTGGSYGALAGTLVNQVVSNASHPGIFGQDIKTNVITSVAQYSRNYTQTVSEGLNFRWYQYVGSTITTTRCFCHAMTEKRFFHRSEIPKLIKGEFPEFEKRECELNPKTDLPEGFIKGTNSSNFMTYAGGWNCQHSIFPVPDSAVPHELREKFKDAA